MKDKKQTVDCKNEAFLKYANSIIATLRGPFLVLDKDLRVISANQIFYTTFNVAKKDTIGRLLSDLNDRQWDIPALMFLLKEILSEKKNVKDYEVECEFEQIGRRVMCFNACQLHVPKKLATMIAAGARRKKEKASKEEKVILMAIEDITDRKQTGKELAQSKERQYRTLIENLPQKIFLKDKNSVFMSCNENYARDLKIRAEEIYGKTDYDFFPTRLAEKYRADDKRVMESGNIENIEEQYLVIGDFRADFEEVVINTVKVPLYDENGKATGVLGIFWDITERKKAEDKIRDLKKQIEYILGVTKTGLDIIDSNLNMVYIDPEWQKVYEDPKGRKCYEYFMGRKKECPDCGVRKALETKNTAVTEKVLPKEGNRVVQVTSIPFQDKDSNWFVAEVNVDITERKKAEGQLRQAKERAELLYNVVPSAIFTVDKDRRITSWNNTATKLTGYTAEEAIGKECFIFAEAPCKEKCGLYADDVTKPIFGKECTIKRKDGEIRIISKNVDSLRDLDGNIIGGVESFEDVTEHKRAETQLEISERKLRALFDQTFQFIGMMTPDGKLVEANRSAMQFAGITESDCIDKFFWDTAWWTHSVEMQDKLRESVKKAANGEIIFFEATHLASDKSLHYIDFSLKPVKDQDGKVIFLIPEGRDITERKQYEEELKKYRDHLEELVKEKTKEIEESEIRFKTIFEYARDGILLADVESRKFSMCNKMMCDMLGCSEEEVKQLNINDIHPEEELPHIVELFEKLARGESTTADGLPVKRKDGTILYVDITSSTITLSGKKYLMGIFRDVTERKKAEVAFMEAVKAKTTFIGMVSHELRTPLAAIKEGVSVVLDKIVGGINEDQQKYLKIVNNNVDRLSRLIDGVLDFQTLESGKMEFDIEENDMNEVVKEMWQEMLPLADKKNLSFTCQLYENLPRIRFDHDRIIQVLTNLLNNALKFTEKGGIALVVSRGENFVQVVIKDTGIGIKEENMEKLFQEFTQLQRKIGGTGLGLSICKKIIEMHKGKIWAESEFGKGTAFYFVLPIKERRA